MTLRASTFTCKYLPVYIYGVPKFSTLSCQTGQKKSTPDVNVVPIPPIDVMSSFRFHL